MSEVEIVNIVYRHLIDSGCIVATEIANFSRCADIAAIDQDKNVLVVECKLNAIKKALKQIKTHRLSADKVFIATNFKSLKKQTLDNIKNAGIGLIFVMPDETVSYSIYPPSMQDPWGPARARLIKRIQEAQ